MQSSLKSLHTNEKQFAAIECDELSGFQISAIDIELSSRNGVGKAFRRTIQNPAL